GQRRVVVLVVGLESGHRVWWLKTRRGRGPFTEGHQSTPTTRRRGQGQGDRLYPGPAPRAVCRGARHCSEYRSGVLVQSEPVSSRPVDEARPRRVSRPPWPTAALLVVLL